MSRKLVVLLDGTGNEIGSNLSNVLKFYTMLKQTADQLVYYDPGVGTIGHPGWWSAFKQQVHGVLGLALGYGLDENVLDAYAWLVRNYRDGDQVYLLGFSRGAYTARVLAGFMHMCGLLHADQLNLCGYALVTYKRAAEKARREDAKIFRRLTDARRPVIRFMGVWDTVSAVITPRPDRFYVPGLLTLPYTARNPSVRVFRHAIAMDERRRMFRLNHWRPRTEPPGDPEEIELERRQDVRQVWFAGVHSDVGGGYPEEESGLSKFPLLWMIEQVRALGADGLSFDDERVDRLARGIQPEGANPNYRYVTPDPKAQIHKSLTGPWWILEGLTKKSKYKEWPRRLSLFWRYFPGAEPRPVPNRPWQGLPATDPFLVHSSVRFRIAECPEYRPINLPAQYDVETVAGPAGPVPEVPSGPYRPESLGRRLKRLFTTMPDRKAWTLLGAAGFALAILFAILGGCGGFVAWDPKFTREIALVVGAGLGLALFEETLFRGVLMPAPSDGASGLGPAVLSAILFALWHPAQIELCRWLTDGHCLMNWADIAWSPWFLAATFALGLACGKLVDATRSIWPAVALHWLTILVWATLFGAPLGFASPAGPA